MIFVLSQCNNVNLYQEVFFLGADPTDLQKVSVIA